MGSEQGAYHHMCLRFETTVAILMQVHVQRPDDCIVDPCCLSEKAAAAGSLCVVVLHALLGVAMYVCARLGTCCMMASHACEMLGHSLLCVMCVWDAAVASCYQRAWLLLLLSLVLC